MQNPQAKTTASVPHPPPPHPTAGSLLALLQSSWPGPSPLPGTEQAACRPQRLLPNALLSLFRYHRAKEESPTVRSPLGATSLLLIYSAPCLTAQPFCETLPRD